MVLLDYSYKGADGEGTTQFDNELFWAKHDDRLRKQLEQIITTQELQTYQEGLTALARKSVAFATTKEDNYSRKGNSRFGGLPDLPAHIPYPSFKDYQGNEKGMQFIAQINCTDIAHLQDYLPRTGILYFFIEDQEDTDAKVIYYDGDLSALQSAGQLDITEDYIYDQHGIYTPYKVIADKYASLPSFYNARDYYAHSWPELEALEEEDDATDALKQALEPDFKAIHSINSYVFKQHDTPEKEAVHAFKGKPEDWMVLLKVGSDSQPGFCFWDAGEIYFVIHKVIWRRKTFQKSIADWKAADQSGIIAKGQQMICCPFAIK
ncbi:YwqG family protein [Chitinophaga pinensis]|uniref:YwqG family protein n=1 Tax=Chitinophaga pinensis TaxID=79329 RepID=UPI001C99EE4D|nr:YwqG family protein [Chitinophaga pinensis]